VAPVLEQLAGALHAPRQGAVVGPETGEQRELVGPGDHVDRVELDHAHRPEGPAHVAPVDDRRPRGLERRGRQGGRGGRVGQALGPQGDASGLAGRQPLPRPADAQRNLAGRFSRKALTASANSGVV
jgi:hypothetical protein